MLSCLSRVAKVATRLRHLVFNLWWAERPVVFLTCVPQCWQVIVILLLESLFIDCLSISDLHLSWSEVCLEISLLFWRFLALSRIMRRYLSKKLWLWASVLAIFALYQLLNEVERGFVRRLFSFKNFKEQIYFEDFLILPIFTTRDPMLVYQIFFQAPRG